MTLDNCEVKNALSTIMSRFASGEFDKYLEIPFINKDKIFVFIKNKVNQKHASGQNPLLTEYEIKDCITTAIENAGVSFKIFLQCGILQQNEDKTYELTRVGKKILSPSFEF